MSNSGFTCPCCGNKLSIKKTLLLSNFSKTKCDECGTVLKLNSNLKTGLGWGILGAIACGTVFYVALHSMFTYGFLNGLLMGLGVGIGFYLLSILFAYFFSTLKIVEEGKIVYFKEGKFRQSHLQPNDFNNSNAILSKEKDLYNHKISQSKRNHEDFLM